MGRQNVVGERVGVAVADDDVDNVKDDAESANDDECDARDSRLDMAERADNGSSLSHVLLSSMHRAVLCLYTDTRPYIMLCYSYNTVMSENLCSCSSRLGSIVISLMLSKHSTVKPRLNQGNMLPGNIKLLVAVNNNNNIVASLLSVCCWIQRDNVAEIQAACCRQLAVIE